MKQNGIPTIVRFATLGLVLASAASWALYRRALPAAPRAAPRAAAAGLSPEVVMGLTPSEGSTAADKMVSKYLELVRKAQKDDRAWVAFGDALMQKARETADGSYYGRAEKAYTQALFLNGSSVSALNGMAWVTSCRHEFEQSIDWANRATALDPQDNDAYGLLGDAHVEMGDYDQAYLDYQKMIDIRPDISSYSRGAHLLQLTNDLRKASWLMAKAVNCGGPYAENTAWCRTQVALMQYSSGAYPMAEQVLEVTLRHAPHNYQVLAAMGRVKAALKQYPAAIDYYKRSIAVVPQHDSLVALGDLYTLAGDNAQAEKQYALVETIHQLQKANGIRGDWQIAQFYAEHNLNVKQALQLAEEEYKTRKNVYVADTLAWCYYRNGRYQEAKEMIGKALAHHTPEANFLYHAGMIYAKLGDRVTASKCLYHAMSLSSNFSPLNTPRAEAELKALGSEQTETRAVSLRE